MSWKSLTTRKGNKPKSMFTASVKKPMPVKVISQHYKQPSRRGVTNRIARAYGNPVAQRTLAWLRYGEILTFSTGAGGVAADYQFNLNSIFDCDRTGVGHQPYGHDTYQTLYQRYRVKKCKWRIVVGAATSQGVGTLAPTLSVYVVPVNNTIGINTSLGIEQSSFGRGAVINVQGDSSHTFTGMVDLQKLNGVKKSEYDDDDRFEANFGASPTELMGLHVILECPNGLVATCTAQVTLEYYVEMFDPIQLAQS